MPSYATKREMSGSNIAGSSSASNEWTTELMTLTKGSVFAGRYMIDENRSDSLSHCCLATDTASANNVFLKFFSRSSPGYENAVKRHKSLESGHGHVCKMLDHLDGACGFPPCLVMEKGDYSLADRLEGGQLSTTQKKAILYNMLEAVEYLHSQGIVHGDLNPSHFMWFSNDFSWKLISLGHARREEELSISHQSRPYDSPEMIQASSKRRTGISLERSMDMWCMGILTFEILTHSCVRDVHCVLEYVKDCLEAPLSRMNEGLRQHHRDQGADWTRLGHQREAFLFVQSLLQLHPNSRKTASQALDDTFFFPGAGAFESSNGRLSAVSCLEHGRQLFSLSTCVGRRDHQLIEPSSFYGIKADGVPELSDFSTVLDMLSTELRDCDSYLFSIRISPLCNSPLRIQEIREVSVATLQLRFVDLEFGQARVNPDVIIATIIPCSDNQSFMEELGIRRDERGHITMHLTLKIRLEVISDNSPARTLDLFTDVHCEMVSNEKVAGSRRFPRFLKSVWKRLPQGVRSCVGKRQVN